MFCQFLNVPVNQTHKHSLLQHWKFLQHINEQSLVPVPSSGKAMQANFLDSASCRQLVTTVFQPAGWWAATRWMMYVAGRSPPAVIHNLLAPIRTTTHRTMYQSWLASSHLPPPLSSSTVFTASLSAPEIRIMIFGTLQICICMYNIFCTKIFYTDTTATRLSHTVTSITLAISPTSPKLAPVKYHKILTITLTVKQQHSTRFKHF